jgi:hypothetical protein
MTFPHSSKIDTTSLVGMNHLGHFISHLQFTSGAIPSNKDGSHDPWDHLEAVMGLATLGFTNEALLGLQWMKDNQNEDGSWYNLYKDSNAIEKNKQSNFSTYLAVAVWHNYLLTNDLSILENFWDSIERGMIFTLSLQNDNGAIAWNIDDSGNIDEDYLLTGCSSIAKSIECSIAMCKILDKLDFQSTLIHAHSNLLNAIKNPIGIFDLKKDRSRFSMDWYYPVLSGATQEDKFANLIKAITNIFWVPGFGIKCVADEPWVTVAETCECSIAFKKMGYENHAKELLLNAAAIVDENSIPFMGWQLEEKIYWPEEQPSWTAGALILAADANNALTKASNLFLIKQFSS